ncbi:PadR family transcriptional regulator [Paenibacillus sp. FSL H7-0357]|uniref:PadR family transcriptional regulator n=1 Tax=Paenibacillus borealis TaxID=160799 RepID=A0ABX3HG61_PAEBO|nr:PadR family transcriptional regulator [Paenibacillus sp. FSL H7-0357]OMD49541.1 PadR family transcriptional regulator [Paenibacillus borealis]
MDMSEWISQVRRGLLEYCILQLISSQPRYGYELVTALGQWEVLAVNEGTLYPLLRRLLKENYLEAFWKESETGPRRKYYSLTPPGRELLASMTEEWSKVVGAIGQIQLY